MNLVVDHWSYDPFLIVAVMILAWHEVGLRRLMRRSRHDRVGRLRRHAILFYAGIGVLLVAVESPIDYWADDYFFMHMIQHLLLLFAAPSLIVAGAPWQPLLLGVPLRWRRRCLRAILHGGWSRPLRAAGRALVHPLVAVAAFNIVMLLWQIPALFDLAERNQMIHIWLMHGSMFAVGILFWLQIIPSAPLRTRITPAGQAGALVGTSIIMWMLAMAMSLFTQHSWYPVYDHIPGAIMSPFADQQIGAGILWVCGDLWAIPALIVVVRRLIAQEGDVDSAIQSILGSRPAGRSRWPSASHWS
jgi:cytochrome c oxidase assembly factor CtaG